MRDAYNSTNGRKNNNTALSFTQKIETIGPEKVSWNYANRRDTLPNLKTRKKTSLEPGSPRDKRLAKLNESGRVSQYS